MGGFWGKVGGTMSDLSTALRVLFTRRRDPVTVFSYLWLIGLVVVVVVAGAMVVADQVRGL